MRLSLRNKVIFLALAIIWTSLLLGFIYYGHIWDKERQRIWTEDHSPETYYP